MYIFINNPPYTFIGRENPRNQKVKNSEQWISFLMYSHISHFSKASLTFLITSKIKNE